MLCQHKFSINLGSYDNLQESHRTVLCQHIWDSYDNFKEKNNILSAYIWALITAAYGFILIWCSALTVTATE